MFYKYSAELVFEDIRARTDHLRAQVQRVIIEHL